MVPSIENGHDGAIAFEGVSVERGGQRVIRFVTLHMNERRIGLVGDNGAGKSTLLRLATGLLAPGSGRVTVGGKDVVKHRKSLPTEIGIVFQNPDHQILFPTVSEELMFGLQERGLDKRSAQERVRDLLERQGCLHLENRAVSELSEGQKQLVCILAIIAGEPRNLLLDEPFASLDLPTCLRLSSWIATLPQRIVMASHNLDLFSRFDRVIWLADGEVRQDGPPAEVVPAYRAHCRERSPERGGVLA